MIVSLMSTVSPSLKSAVTAVSEHLLRNIDWSLKQPRYVSRDNIKNHHYISEKVKLKMIHWFDLIWLTVGLSEVDIFLLIGYKMSRMGVLSNMSLSVASRGKKLRNSKRKNKSNNLTTVKRFKLMDCKIWIVFSQQSLVYRWTTNTEMFCLT